MTTSRTRLAGVTAYYLGRRADRWHAALHARRGLESRPLGHIDPTTTTTRAHQVAIQTGAVR
jgi:hypothetical protein